MEVQQWLALWKVSTIKKSQTELLVLCVYSWQGYKTQWRRKKVGHSNNPQASPLHPRHSMRCRSDSLAFCNEGLDEKNKLCLQGDMSDIFQAYTVFGNIACISKSSPCYRTWPRPLNPDICGFQYLRGDAYKKTDALPVELTIFSCMNMRQ